MKSRCTTRVEHHVRIELSHEDVLRTLRAVAGTNALPGVFLPDSTIDLSVNGFSLSEDPLVLEWKTVEVREE